MTHHAAAELGPDSLSDPHRQSTSSDAVVSYLHVRRRSRPTVHKASSAGIPWNSLDLSLAGQAAARMSRRPDAAIEAFSRETSFDQKFPARHRHR
jgi:hypothetical protein